MLYDNLLSCPVCGGKLLRKEGSLCCEANHCFDIARKGYVNLLPPSGHGGHGDDKLMVRARTEFLNRGYYDKLSRTVAELCAAHLPQGGVVLDAGCGEGKYTVEVLEAAREKNPRVIGIDISKEALMQAAGRSRELCLAVASTAKMPVGDGTADILLNIFSPWMEQEFARVLKPNGLLLRVIPLERHLWELKALLYDRPYENDVPEGNTDCFEVLETKDLRDTVDIGSQEDLQNLFKMTPYYYKTSAADQAKLAEVSALTVTLEFRILLCRPRP